MYTILHPHVRFFTSFVWTASATAASREAATYVTAKLHDTAYIRLYKSELCMDTLPIMQICHTDLYPTWPTLNVCQSVLRIYVTAGTYNNSDHGTDQ